VSPLTREAFLLRGALAVGATYGAGAVSPFVAAALGQPLTTDVTILNFALNLEQLEAAFYADAIDMAPLSGDVLRLAQKLAANEQAHVEALTSAIKGLGADPDPAPAFSWGGALASQASFVKAAVRLEDIGVSAYNGAGPMLQDKKLLATAGSIVQVEARHAALVRALDGQPPTVAAFDQTLTQPQVLELVARYIQH
jgi:rubrerythrin